MADEDDETISLEGILVEIIDAQLAMIDAIAGGKPLTDVESLQARLNDLRDLLEQSDAEADEE
jgi:hypothetical protein